MTGESTALEIEEDEDNIEEIHERNSLLQNTQKKIKNKSCYVMLAKVLLITLAGVLFILMLVELWSDYGNVISTQTFFPPKVYSVTETCPDAVNATELSTLTKEYNALECVWVQNDVTCTGDIPTNPLALPSTSVNPDSTIVRPSEIQLKWSKEIKDCVRLIVWSI